MYVCQYNFTLHIDQMSKVLTGYTESYINLYFCAHNFYEVVQSSLPCISTPEVFHGIP